MNERLSLDEQVKMMVTAGLTEQAKCMLMHDKIKTVIDANHDWLHQDTFDLNPHLIIRGLCTKISEDITVAGLPCTSDEVMLYWLSFNLFNKKDNLSLKERAKPRFAEVGC